MEYEHIVTTVEATHAIHCLEPYPVFDFNNLIIHHQSVLDSSDISVIN